MVKTLDWRDYLPEGSFYHIRRYPVEELEPLRRLFGHRHNFSEIFLVAGDGVGQNWNGIAEVLPRGGLWRLAPEDWHGMFCTDRTQASGELINIALRQETAECYWPWQEESRGVVMLPAAWRALLLAVEELERDTERGEETIAYFLQTAAYWWRRQQPEMNRTALPDWLWHAVTRAERSRKIPEVAEFARWCNRCPAHVGRAMREALGVTTGEFLIRLRLKRASRELAQGEGTLEEVAARAGFAHASSFHRAFARQFHCTPRHYRELHCHRLL